jgi:preprotein translocase subunit YajC
MLSYALLAEDPPKGPQPGGEMPFFMNPLFILALFMLFMFVVVLPGNRKAKKAEEAMRTGLKKGQKVVTMSGIVGTVTGIQDGSEEVTIRSEDTKLKVLRSSILKVLGEEAADANKT